MRSLLLQKRVDFSDVGKQARLFGLKRRAVEGGRVLLDGVLSA